MDFSECWNDTCSNVSIAAKLGDITLLRRLIQEERPVDVSDNRGWKPLHEAAAVSTSVECLEELLKHEDTQIDWVTHEGETALLLACKRRSQADAAVFVRLLLQYGANPNIHDNEEETPLLAAVRNNLSEVVNLLLEAGANVNARDCSNWSALHEAASKNDIQILRMLLRKGACLEKKDECGMTPLFTAAQHGAESCLLELLKVAKLRGQEKVVNVGAEDWATPLMIAAQQGFVNCVKLLLLHGADPDLKTSDNATVMHMAVEGNHQECLDVLLSKMQLDPIIRLFHPETFVHSSMISPLFLAVEHKSYSCLKSLLSAGFSPNSLYRYGYYTPTMSFIQDFPKLESTLSFAVRKQDEVAMAILFSSGASPNAPHKDAIHPLVTAMHNATAKEFCVLIESGSDVNHELLDPPIGFIFLNSLICTSAILHNNSTFYMRLLLYYGCDINVCFQHKREVFVKLASILLTTARNSLSLSRFLRFILRFVIITRNVQMAVYALSDTFSEDVTDILEEIRYPTTLKQLCCIFIRRHLYQIHGVRLPHMISQLKLPSSVEDYVTYKDLCCI